MKKLKAFYYIFIKSATSFEYYKDLVGTGLSFSIRYLIMLVLITSVILGIAVSVETSAKLQSDVKKLLDQSIVLYPDNLVVTAKDGQLSINQPEPLILKTPEIFQSKVTGKTAKDEMKIPGNLVIFNSNGVLDDVKKLDTLVLVNKTNFLIQNVSKIEVYPTKDVPNGQFGKQNLIDLVAKIKTYIKFIPLGIFALVLITSIFYNLGFRVIYILIATVLLMFAGKAMKLNLNFTKYFKIAIHTTTIPLILEILMGVLSISVGLPFWFLILNTVIGLLVLNKNKNEFLNTVN